MVFFIRINCFYSDEGNVQSRNFIHSIKVNARKEATCSGFPSPFKINFSTPYALPSIPMVFYLSIIISFLLANSWPTSTIGSLGMKKQKSTVYRLQCNNFHSVHIGKTAVGVSSPESVPLEP